MVKAKLYRAHKSRPTISSTVRPAQRNQNKPIRCPKEFISHTAKGSFGEKIIGVLWGDDISLRFPYLQQYHWSGISTMTFVKQTVTRSHHLIEYSSRSSTNENYSNFFPCQWCCISLAAPLCLTANHTCRAPDAWQPPLWAPHLPLIYFCLISIMSSPIYKSRIWKRYWSLLTSDGV